MTDILQVRPAAVDDTRAIFSLIDGAAGWLRTKKQTDQWARPWPNEVARDDRIFGSVLAERTWMVEDSSIEDGDTRVGTITVGPGGNRKLWEPEELLNPAVYVSRLVVRRTHAGRGIGAALIDWAGRHGINDWNAKLIRVDVWTSNHALHNYYEKQGFTRVRTCNFEDSWEYPSAVLLEKPTAEIDEFAAASFKEVSSSA